MIVAEPYASPEYGRTLHADTPHSLSDGRNRYPVVDEIPYLRVGRDELAARALAALDRGNAAEAAATLLADRDDWDRTTPPSQDALLALVRSVATSTFRDALDGLAFGGVSAYFAHRWSDPTFVAGLGLLAAHRPRDGARSFEIACGAGHYLAELARLGVAADGGDVVFAKLWLARHWIAPHARLVCFDARAPWPIASHAYDLVHVHDALYFLPRKTFVADEMRRIARPGGTLAISHAHNAAVDNLSAGEPLDRAGYAALLPDAAMYDDRAFAAAVVAADLPRRATRLELERAPAFAFVAGPTAASPRACDDDVAVPSVGTTLTRNPLYGTGGASIDWPSPRYEREYASLATYPARSDAPARATMTRDGATAAYARTRELVALPERW